MTGVLLLQHSFHIVQGGESADEKKAFARLSDRRSERKDRRRKRRPIDSSSRRRGRSGSIRMNVECERRRQHATGRQTARRTGAGAVGFARHPLLTGARSRLGSDDDDARSACCFRLLRARERAQPGRRAPTRLARHLLAPRGRGGASQCQQCEPAGSDGLGDGGGPGWSAGSHCERA